MKTKLTLRMVGSAKPKAAPYEMRDTDLKGLLLRVQPSGAKSYVVEWARGKRRTIGRHPVMTLAGARQTARALLVEIDAHGEPLAAIENRSHKVGTFGEFIRDEYAAWALANQKHGQATIDALASTWGDLYVKPLGDILALDVERIKSRRLKAGIAPATVNRDLDRIRGALSCAVEWRMLDASPMRGVKRVKGADNARVRYLAKDEERRLRKALADREALRRTQRENTNRWNVERHIEPREVWPRDGFTDHLMPLVLVAMNTGLRRGELFGLAWADVDLHRKMLTVRSSNAKSRRARHVPLNVEALDVLKRWQSDADGLVWPGAGGGRLTNVNKAWGGIVAAAKLGNFHFHDLRHDFASKLVMAGVDLNTVRELMGHADIKMTLRYAHLAPERTAAAVALIGTAR